jgi:phosphatidylglycerol:prolipoprotein diacylglycerol transferase
MFATATLTWAAENGLDLGFFTLRYYSLLFAAGFFLGYRQMRKWFASAGLTNEQLDTLLTTMVVATVVGARLGHVFFYDWHYYQNHLVEILYVWEGGLASHGAAAAILVAVFWYAKYVINKPYLWMMDRLVITVALAAVFIRTGNLMNSEIYGEPANSVAQTVFARPVLDLIDNHYGHALTGARLERDANRPDRETDSLNLPAYRLVVQPAEGMGPGELDALWEGQLMPHLQSRPKDRIHFVGAPEAEVVALENGEFALPGYGIPRHPTQVYEALFYLFVYGLLILMALRGSFKASGRIFGAFLIGVFGFRFVVEFLKANQSSFEAGMALNMGQWLSLPLVAVGLYLLWQSRTKHQND